MKTYKPIRKGNYFIESSRNKSLSIVFSESKKDGHKKYWVYKPFNLDYDTFAIINEVFIGQLLVALFSKNQAAKNKINFSNLGVISRVLVNNTQAHQDFFQYTTSRQRNIELPDAALETLLKALCAKIILGDRDIKMENFVVVSDGKTNIPQFLYSIDHEFCLTSDRYLKLKTAPQFLESIATEPKNFAYTLLDDTNGWCDKSARKALTDKDRNWFLEHLGLSKFTKHAIFTQMLEIATRLTADDYSLIKEVANNLSNEIRAASIGPTMKRGMLDILRQQYERVKSHANIFTMFVPDLLQPPKLLLFRAAALPTTQTHSKTNEPKENNATPKLLGP